MYRLGQKYEADLPPDTFSDALLVVLVVIAVIMTGMYISATNAYHEAVSCVNSTHMEFTGKRCQELINL